MVFGNRMAPPRAGVYFPCPAFEIGWASVRTSSKNVEKVTLYDG